MTQAAPPRENSRPLAAELQAQARMRPQQYRTKYLRRSHQQRLSPLAAPGPRKRRVGLDQYLRLAHRAALQPEGLRPVADKYDYRFHRFAHFAKTTRQRPSLVAAEDPDQRPPMGPVPPGPSARAGFLAPQNKPHTQAHPATASVPVMIQTPAHQPD